MPGLVLGIHVSTPGRKEKDVDGREDTPRVGMAIRRKFTGSYPFCILGMQGATQESVAAIKEIGGTIAQISSIASTIASAVQQQSAATQEIARSVQSVAQGTHQAAANIMKVNRGATETGSASAEVLNSAKTLSTESTRLRDELNRFMANIRAA